VIIYIYTTETYQHKNWYKIGQTTRTAEKRIGEQDSTSNPEPLIMIKSFDVPDHVTDSLVRDNLIKSGYPQVRHKREWIEIDGDPMGPVWTAISEIPLSENSDNFVTPISIKKVTLDESDGKYVGETKSGIYKHGNGIKRWNNGDIFEGLWEYDNFIDGVFVYKNGVKFEGTFKTNSSGEKIPCDGHYIFNDNKTTVSDGFTIELMEDFIKVIEYQEIFESRLKKIQFDESSEVIKEILESMAKNNIYLKHLLWTIRRYEKYYYDECETKVIHWVNFTNSYELNQLAIIESQKRAVIEKKRGIKIIISVITSFVLIIAYGYYQSLETERKRVETEKIVQERKELKNRQEEDKRRIEQEQKESEKRQQEEQRRVENELIKKKEDNILSFSKTFICPEALSSSKETIDQNQRFVKWYRDTHGNATPDNIVEMRIKLLKDHECIETLKNIPETREYANQIKPRTLVNGSYLGNFFDGQMNGKGIFYFENGDRIEGIFKNGSANGRGTYYYTSGARYEGIFKNGMFDGGGNFFYTNGNRYEGMYKNGKPYGKGILYFPNGDRLEGIIKNDKFVGQGTYYYTNGDKDFGTFDANGKLDIKNQYFSRK
jgi:hypothetical protein